MSGCGLHASLLVGDGESAFRFALSPSLWCHACVACVCGVRSPNSCGQVQVADIGLMGGPAKKWDEEEGKMKAVPGVKIFVGGRVGEDAHLALDTFKEGIPMDDDDLLPELVAIAKEHFGAVDK